ncbi:hypothetical protein KIW84_053414 [Lathyrus oleraceus]|uniref:Uncharacterized protein n=1 Tax=Pisum sativum TaxID=3888 RepID=A0A9D5AGP4_PEA|nr:hypothetical protein KIW84_053414 [Pisum sativum]
MTFSDDHPILVCLREDEIRRIMKIFHFESTWILGDDYEDWIKEVGNDGHTVPRNLEHFKNQTSERIRAFIWLVNNDNLITNLLLSRMNIRDPYYQDCMEEIENMICAMRDCAVAKPVWLSLVRASSQSISFNAVFFPAEMWGVLKGIIFALGKGYMKIELQTYNKSIVEAINKRVHLSVDIYIQHTLSQPEYYDGQLDEIVVEKNDIVDESEEVFAAMETDVRGNDARETNVRETSDEVHGDVSFGDNEDESFNYDSAMDVAFDDKSDEYDDELVEEDEMTNLIDYVNEDDQEGNTKKGKEKW